MTIEDLYLKIKKSKELSKLSPLFNIYVITYEAWLSSPNNEKYLETIYKILTDLDKCCHEKLKELCDGDFNELTLPTDIAEPEWIVAKKEIVSKTPVDLKEITRLMNLTQKEALELIAQQQEKNYPSLKKQAANFLSSMKDFAMSGFKTVTDEQYKTRRAICEGCQFFDRDGFGGTGRCKKCGCSSLKLNIAASRCPFGLWDSIE